MRGAILDRTGQPLAKSLEEQKMFPELSVEMIEVGESTGALPAMLGSVAEFYEEDVQTALGAAMALIDACVRLLPGVRSGLACLVARILGDNVPARTATVTTSAPEACRCSRRSVPMARRSKASRTSVAQPSASKASDASGSHSIMKRARPPGGCAGADYPIFHRKLSSFQLVK